MKLGELIRDIEYSSVIGNAEIEVCGLCTDSQSVKEGDLFFCYRGKENDSHEFAYEAVERGAVALVCEQTLELPVTQVIVKDARSAIATLARTFYGYADKKLKIVAVTGTNGKTTTTYMLESIFKKANLSAGVIGTLGIGYADKFISPELTTPDPVFLHRVLKDMYDCGVKYVFMEVSAHALYFDKIKGLNFEAGVFTNCTQDHLDFFGNMTDYADCKKLLFKKGRCKYAVVNADDKLGQSIMAESENCISFGLKNPSDVFCVDIEEKINGTNFVINLFDELYEINLNIPTVNTPDGLEKSLQALRKLCTGKLYCVFGCGGNRDKSKRPIMGEIAGKNSDFCIITSDNPRFEDPYDIITQIEQGIKKTGKSYVTVTDRETATEYAIKLLNKGDILLIAGKGGEYYQEIMGIKHSYNDNEVIKKIIG